MKIYISNIYLTDDADYIKTATEVFNNIKKSIEELAIENNSIIAFQLAVPHNFFVYNIEKHDSIIDINKIVNSLPEELAIWIR
ncbi:MULTISPECIES: hypothetical protein [Myroides]|uniref:Uncharacterized protein n=2 Tax=Myroides odoratimimus TaxID=76832 RepID=A0AAI8C7N2_9FLAO|nr:MULTISPECIES: hypothetical protein [Myroides]ALU26836.1 hypothetical protein AS202_12065 [Myroides odoratimimus]ALU27495.1 hypothetical protein AS202_15685 [Myroides odoratimimus]EHO06163.1 hypothetical protein HMPREF9712_03226 [Myroides odoratimimus CCUG 10230]MDM1036300.1 hypothetical protein [Myroides odoratimimus]MDM1362616.1 hypothetical protein [Myroides marinus]